MKATALVTRLFLSLSFIFAALPPPAVRAQAVIRSVANGNPLNAYVSTELPPAAIATCDTANHGIYVQQAICRGREAVVGHLNKAIVHLENLSYFAWREEGPPDHT